MSTFTPVVSGEVVYFGSLDGHLIAINRAVGQEAWKLKLPGTIWESPVVSSGSIYLAPTIFTTTRWTLAILMWIPSFGLRTIETPRPVLRNILSSWENRAFVVHQRQRDFFSCRSCLAAHHQLSASSAKGKCQCLRFVSGNRLVPI